MRASAKHRILIATAAIGLAATATAFVFWHRTRDDRPRAPTRAADAAPSAALPQPKLYCEFYNFMHNAVVVSFYFAVARSDAATPTFHELYVVEPDGTKTNFDDQQAPAWSFAVDDSTPTLVSPTDGTRIILYGLKPEVAGTFWVEAGLRSNAYRNLEGKCRQSGFGRLSTKTGL